MQRPRLPAARSRRAFLGLLAALLAARVAYLAPRLLYPDLVLDYPFPGGDGLDWIRTAFAWAGYPVGTPSRPPLLPLLLAGLDRLGLLAWFPPLHQLVWPAGCLALYLVLSRWHPPLVAFGATLVPVLSGVATALSLEVMADTLAAVLLFGAVLAVIAAERQPRWYLAAGALGGLSALTQQTALLLPLVAGSALLLRRPSELRRPHLWDGAILFAFVASPLLWGAWQVTRGQLAGTMSDQWRLLGWGPEPVFYLGAAARLWGLPALVLAVAGLVALLRAGSFRGWLLLSFALAVGGFFVLFYTFSAERFLLYLLLPSAIAIAAALAAVRRPAFQVVAAAVAAAWAAWPIPGGVAAPSRLLLLPVPGIYVDLSQQSPVILRAAPGAAWRDSVWYRVASARPRRPAGPPLEPERFAGYAGAVFLHPEGAGGGAARYDGQMGITAALRRRVQWVPATLHPPGWWGWRDRRFLGIARGYAFFEVRLPGLAAPVLAVFEQSDPAWRRVRRRAPQPPPPASCVRAEQERAAVAGAAASAGDPLAALFLSDPPREWQRLLPFRMTGGTLVVLKGPQASDARRRLATEPVVPLVEVEGLRIGRGILYGRSVVAIEEAPGGDDDPCSGR